MNTINPASTHPDEDIFPSHYLGMPVKKGFEGYWDPPFSDMVTIITHIKKRFPGKDPQPNDDQCLKFLLSWETLPYAVWQHRIQKFVSTYSTLRYSPMHAWAALFEQLASPVEPIFEDPNPLETSIQEKEKIPAAPELPSFNPDLSPLQEKEETTAEAHEREEDGLKYGYEIERLRMEKERAQEQARAERRVDHRPTPRELPKKINQSLPIHPSELLKKYILKKAPSKSYELVYSTTLIKCQNHYSSKGKQIYRYGQAHIGKITGLNRWAVDRAWAWLKKRGIFNKAWNENHDDNKCSGWYVCTSLKQIGYFRDPRTRARKITR